MAQQAKQIDMSFAGDERLGSAMMKGRFGYFLECDSPRSSQSFNASMALFKELGLAFRQQEQLQGWLLSDRALSEQCHDPAPLAETLAKASDKPVIMAVSGRGSDLERCKSSLAEGKATGRRDFLALSGDLSDLEDESGNKPYTDSVDILRSARSQGKDLRLGAVVNPFKYRPEDQSLQYAKMLRKIHGGAQFLVAQAGWDMKKAQELQWFLQKMNLPIAVIARVCVFSQEEAKALAEGYKTGIHLPIPLACLIQQDAEKSREEFIEMQLLRAAWQILGYKKLGYAAVLLSGLHKPKNWEKLLHYVEELEKLHPDYNTWLQLWSKQYGELNFVPGQDPHFLYHGLLQKNKRDFDPEEDPVQGSALPKPAWQDRWRYWLGQKLDDPRKNAKAWDLLRRLCRLPKERLQELRPCFYLNNQPCPKKLRWGACGNAGPDGLCENRRQPCFFHRVLHLAAHTNNYQDLESAAD